MAKLNSLEGPELTELLVEDWFKNDWAVPAHASAWLVEI